MSSRTALIRKPSPRLAEGIVSHREREPVDYHLACIQWDAYVNALHESGWQTVEVPPAENCPDGVFIEDTMLVYKNVAVISRPGADSRKPEIIEAETTVEALGLSINRIRPPGTLDGGDVLKVGDTIYVGRGGRTNGAGIRQLRDILSPLGATVIAVPISKVLHLKSAVTALPDGSVIGYLPLVDDARIFDRFVPMPEESGAHVVDLGAGRLLIADDCPGSTELITQLGYQPVPVDIGEFEKLEGCVTCLSVRLRGLPH
ncbi:MAG: dimethylargininase [Jatrophihabitans sp.]